MAATEHSGYHRPVLLEESIDLLEIREGGVYVDVTFGGGGHSREILRRLSENGRLIAFDRPGEGRKVHVQTLCAIAHLDYYQPSSYEQAFLVLRKLRLPATDVDELYRRMVFNVCTRNLDDHTKNFSFMMDRKGTWRLAPAYDLTFAHGPNVKWHKLSVNGRRRDISEEDLLAIGKEMNVKSRKRIIEEVREGLLGWKGFANEAGLEPKLADLIAAQLPRKI